MVSSKKRIFSPKSFSVNSEMDKNKCPFSDPQKNFWETNVYLYR